MLIAAGIGFLVNHEFHRYRLNQAIDQIEQTVKQEPGYVVLNVKRNDKTLEMTLLRSTESRTVKQVSENMASQAIGLSVKLNATEIHFGPLPKPKRAPPPKPLPVLMQLNQLVAAIQQTKFYFESGETALGAPELAKIPLLINQIKQVAQLSRTAKLNQYQLMITGFADKSGSRYGKKLVSQQRAEMIKSLLIKNGIADNIIVAWGAGHLDRAYVTENVQRRVTIQVLFQ